ncbi:microtubule-associated serine/threonine-protein kinase 2-like [Anomaloglossus baeobatrachus]|uniref:microtubule-associated serine/threonine-protein kinase 2-like n=1 Tax=Anomaloglossus baeobatrachus TaxID=238106 RepID=UPI003F504501
MDDIPWKFNNSSLLPDAQDIITELLRKNPAHRLGTGGAREIKSHPFLSNVDFNNLLSKEPQFVPDFESEEDTGYFDTRCSRYQHNDSDEEDQSEDNDWPESQNFVSSSVRLSKLCSNNTTMMNNEEAESPPGYSPESAEHSDMQKESSSKSDSENQYSTAKGSKSPPISVIRSHLFFCQLVLNTAPMAPHGPILILFMSLLRTGITQSGTVGKN